MMQRLARFFALLLLLFTGAAGLLNGLNQIGDRHTPLQMTVTVGVFLYGVLGLAAAVGVFARRAWRQPLIVAWGVAITYVGTVAPRAYGGPDVPLVAPLVGGAAMAVIAFVVWWAAKVDARTHPA